MLYVETFVRHVKWITILSCVIAANLNAEADRTLFLVDVSWER
jgi:hypothetical protein